MTPKQERLLGYALLCAVVIFVVVVPTLLIFSMIEGRS